MTGPRDQCDPVKMEIEKFLIRTEGKNLLRTFSKTFENLQRAVVEEWQTRGSIPPRSYAQARRERYIAAGKK